ncbi:phospholipase [Barnesiella sp. WM24]|uniref:phospholipase A n=1 Tax=Barnesiella sp. WM24 TaxID=2558278 RepID=UPI000A7EF5CF|nr:phospholipase A [Barnesiella sp. WM24]TFU93360.1 phospholipase [Barnesiella sp. WM24]
MLNCRYIIVLLAVFISSLTQARAQIVSPERDQVLDVDSVKKAFDDAPYFGLYKDNYFIFGPAIGMKPTKYNTNVKFQISISQRLTKRTLPFGSYLYLFYTQKCFWDVLRKSFPMTDLNFNPGIGLTKPLFVKDRFIGKVSLILEHESNGKAEEDSRSWNRISFAGNILIDPTMMVHGKIWIPIVDGENNRDLLDYYGLYQFGITYMTPSKRFGGSIILTKRKGWNPFNFNTVLELSYKLFNNENQYLFMQYYNGYGEGLLDYKTFKSQLRVGICIKPQFFSEY